MIMGSSDTDRHRQAEHIEEAFDRINRATADLRCALSLPPEPRGPELVVVRNRAAAMAAGFDEHGRHPVNRDLTAWWPDCGMAGLSCRPLQRVTIDRCVSDRTPEGSLRMILRKRQMTYGPSAVFMEIE
ncbi:hypothetical protein U1872_06420 [Sphingomonas sp. RB3P16]|uniref:hypothetical protein n=1 Tax=Parasphingomonas frigoris TaxID=3096163 RepID=UPI002FC8F0D4